jgi:uncharacterized protein involved in exopolysaccharide biosynthesis
VRHTSFEEPTTSAQLPLRDELGPRLRPEHDPAPGDEPRPLTFAAWVAGALRHWRLAVRTLVVCVVLSGLLALVMRPVYRSAASFVANASKGSRVPQGLGSLAGLAGLSSAMGSLGGDPSESPEFYAQLIQSRELLTRLLDSRFADPRSPGDSATLLAILRVRGSGPEQQRERAVKMLREEVLGVGTDARTSMVFISADMRSPELAAAVVNRTVRYVNEFNLEKRLAKVRPRRQFLEERQAAALRDLTEAEARLRNFYEENRQPRLPPGLTFEEGRLRRQVDITTEIYVGLRREFESARLDEVNDAPLVTVVDSAVVARRRVRPRLGLLLLSGGLVGAVLGLSLAGAAALWSDWAARSRAEVDALRREWRGLRREIANAGRRVVGRRPSPPAASA